MKNSWGYKKAKNAKYKIYSIRGKLLLGYMVPIILILLLGTISYRKAADTVIHNYEISMENTIGKTAEYYELMMSTLSSNVSQIVIDDTLRSYYRGSYHNDPLSEKKKLRELQKKLLKDAFTSDFVGGAYAFAKYGEPCISYLDVKKLDYSAYSQTEEGQIYALAGDKPVFSGYHRQLDEMTGHGSDEYGFSVARNITDQSSKPIGLLLLDISEKAAQEPLLHMELEDGSICALVSGDGRQISGMSSEMQEELMFDQMDVYHEFINGDEENNSSYANFQGSRYLYLFSNVGESQFTICAMIPEEQITGKLRDIQMATMVIVVLALLISTILAGIISTGMTRSIKEISHVMEKVANGDLTVTAKTRGNDEFRRLSEHAGYMLENTRGLIEKTNLVSEDIRSSVGQLTETTAGLVHNTEEINEAIGSVDLGVQLQETDARSCLTQMDELAKQIELADEEAKGAIRRAQGSKAIMDKGMQAIGVLENKAGETAQITGQVITNIETLAEKNRDITEIIGAIKDIATKTNLLSLNARIEAARAGNTGRGFAVVAEEIRKLSEESMHFVERIDDIVTGIEVETQNTVQVAAASEKIVEAQESAMQDTLEAFNEMSSSVDGLAIKIEKMAEGMKLMSQSKDASMEAITNISSVSTQTFEAAERMKRAVERQRMSVEELDRATEELVEEGENLTESISSFKVR